MINVNTKAHILVRDRFTCQFCGTRLFLPQPIKVLDMHVPGLELWDLHGKKEPLRTRWATVDHIKAEAEGGMDILENLVACCVSCNSQKGKATRHPLGATLGDPDWDGLAAIFLGLFDQYQDRLSKEDRKWKEALQRERIAPRLDYLENTVSRLQTAKLDVNRRWEWDRLLSGLKQ
jgi:hypothetical protein